MTTEDLLELIRQIRSCFQTDGYWYTHKGQDGWNQVSEDLNDLLTEADEVLEAAGE